jgi:hypothetical protein
VWKRAFVVLGIALSVVGVAGVAHALPSQSPTVPWPETSGKVRAVEVVNGTIYLGGKFTSATDSAGVTRSVDNLAAFDAVTGRWAAFSTPNLTGSGAEVWDMDVLGDGVVVAGKFGSSGQQRLVKVGPTGAQWFSGVSQALKSVLVAPNGLVYGGGTKLAAWNAVTRQKVWSGRSAVTTNPALRAHTTKPAYRDLMWKDNAIYAACQCDALEGTAVKALVRLSTDGIHDPSFAPSGLNADGAATGLAISTDGIDLYLGAGGSDFFASYTTAGAQRWKRDTSGSVQSVEIFEGVAVIGGHFVEVADQAGDGCGFRSSSGGTLDPNDECQTRKYLAAYELNGTLTSWGPSLTGKYNGTWAIEPEGSALHVGGEFTKASGTARKFYAKFA